MGCCNQAPKGGTGKLSYLMLVIAGLFAAIFFDRRSLGVIRNPRYCKYTVMFIQTL